MVLSASICNIRIGFGFGRFMHVHPFRPHRVLLCVQPIVKISKFYSIIVVLFIELSRPAILMKPRNIIRHLFSHRIAKNVELRPTAAWVQRLHFKWCVLSLDRIMEDYYNNRYLLLFSVMGERPEIVLKRIVVINWMDRYRSYLGWCRMWLSRRDGLTRPPYCVSRRMVYALSMVSLVYFQTIQLWKSNFHFYLQFSERVLQLAK